MKKCEEQFSKDVKNPANFSLDKRSYTLGCRAALEWVLNMFGANTFHGYPPIDVEKTLREELGGT